MISNPGYQKEHEHRAAGLEEARLILSELNFHGAA
jgi:hypothetical protein